MPPEPGEARRRSRPPGGTGRAENRVRRLAVRRRALARGLARALARALARGLSQGIAATVLAPARRRKRVTQRASGAGSVPAPVPGRWGPWGPRAAAGQVEDEGRDVPRVVLATVMTSSELQPGDPESDPADEALHTGMPARPLRRGEDGMGLGVRTFRGRAEGAGDPVGPTPPGESPTAVLPSPAHGRRPASYSSARARHASAKGTPRATPACVRPVGSVRSR